ENALVRIRSDVPLDRVALIGCAVTTGLGAVFNTALVRAGRTVAVIGCGGIGLSVVQGARIAGAGRIVAVDTQAWKLELARRLDEMISARLQLERVNDAFEAMRRGTAARSVIVFE